MVSLAQVHFPYSGLLVLTYSIGKYNDKAEFFLAYTHVWVSCFTNVLETENTNLIPRFKGHSADTVIPGMVSQQHKIRPTTMEVNRELKEMTNLFHLRGHFLVQMVHPYRQRLRLPHL